MLYLKYKCVIRLLVLCFKTTVVICAPECTSTLSKGPAAPFIPAGWVMGGSNGQALGSQGGFLLPVTLLPPRPVGGAIPCPPSSKDSALTL